MSLKYFFSEKLPGLSDEELKKRKVRQLVFFPLRVYLQRPSQGKVRLGASCDLCGQPVTQDGPCEHIKGLLKSFELETSLEDIVRFYKQAMAPRRRLNKDLHEVVEFSIPSREYGYTNAYKVKVLYSSAKDKFSVFCNCKGFFHGGLKVAREEGLLLCSHAALVISLLSIEPFRSDILENVLDEEGKVRTFRSIPHSHVNELLHAISYAIAISTNVDSFEEIMQRMGASEAELVEYILRVYKGRSEVKETLEKRINRNFIQSPVYNTNPQIYTALSKMGIQLLKEDLRNKFLTVNDISPTEHQLFLLKKMSMAEDTVSCIRVVDRDRGGIRILSNRADLEHAAEPQAYHIIRSYMEKEGYVYKDVLRNKILPPLPRVRLEIEMEAPNALLRALGPEQRFTYTTTAWSPKLPDVVWGTDSSIRSLEGMGVELKTGWFEGRYELLSKLRNLFGTLGEHGARANTSCGMHMHIDMWSVKPEVAITYLAVWQALERRFFKEIVAPSRIGNSYCKFLPNNFMEELLFEKKETFLNYVRENQDSLMREIHRAYGTGRYLTLNTLPFFKALEEGINYNRRAYGTYEIRFLHVPRYRGQIQERSAYHAAFLSYLSVLGPYYIATHASIEPHILSVFVDAVREMESEINNLKQQVMDGNMSLSVPENLRKVLSLLQFSTETIPYQVHKKLFVESDAFPNPENPEEKILQPEQAVVGRIKLIHYKKNYREIQQRMLVQSMQEQEQEQSDQGREHEENVISEGEFIQL